MSGLLVREVERMELAVLMAYSANATWSRSSFTRSGWDLAKFPVSDSHCWSSPHRALLARFPVEAMPRSAHASWRRCTGSVEIFVLRSASSPSLMFFSADRMACMWKNLGAIFGGPLTLRLAACTAARGMLLTLHGTSVSVCRALDLEPAVMASYASRPSILPASLLRSMSSSAAWRTASASASRLANASGVSNVDGRTLGKKYMMNGVDHLATEMSHATWKSFMRSAAPRRSIQYAEKSSAAPALRCWRMNLHCL
mmetsp:Transcript_20549/g.68978  ORF Transcript_20549/g.68978 Transcript_20549/m.68978 type:complete len:256 (+) Transcript_20549:338-1105(+)